MSGNAQNKIDNLQTKLEKFTELHNLQKKATKNANQLEFYFS